MKSNWYAASLLLGAAHALNMSELEALYTEGTTPDTANIGGLETTDHECDKAIDESTTGFWLSAQTNTSQSITIQLSDQQKIVSGLTTVPRHNRSTSMIEQHEVALSLNGENWDIVAYGTWWPDTSQKVSSFQPKKAKFLRLSGPAPNGISIADIRLYETEFIEPNPAGGAWGTTIDFPLVPVAGAVDPVSGNFVVCSAWGYNIFTGGKGGKTQTAIWDPKANTVTRRRINETHHDMFCPGISLDTNGKVEVTGGADAGLYHFVRMFVIGGSWSESVGGKNGEVYDTETNVWTKLDGANVSAMLTDDERTYRQDNHGWLFSWTGGSVFQAGPSKEMNGYGTSDTGTTAPAGTRTGDEDAMCGNAIMYDKGKILAFGGSKYYETTEATKYAAIISIDQPDEAANVVALPFDESQPQLIPEMFVLDSTNNQGGEWIEQTKNSVIRVYHSLSLLLQDGTVLTGGGGLCGSCDSNHFDGQIYTPSYLLNADGSDCVRPVIQSVSPNAVKPGDSVEITTDGPVNIQASIIRYGSATHTVNTDQRRISVQLSSTGTNDYSFDIPSEPGIALPGYYMLFVLNNDGTPRHSVNIQVTV
ncbi:uncharacterized protein N7483_012425 [Penicillium malachiteum]|uniref:uncharacterized protein n=1 Tax=Penicillium malachiteum TaxID=1324776 RepID=UPI002548B2B6|nr:uncharacterized protein N7483_012425 [Penicillium malachiteum]KAJ5715244.1 hypothetical protein N7483_012425 [Penicillium malachiteum]